MTSERQLPLFGEGEGAAAARPARVRFCEYPTVCRKDYVGDE